MLGHVAMAKGDGFISLLNRCLNAMGGNTASSGASDMLAAVMKAMGHGTVETAPVDSMAVHVGCYILDRWGFGPWYRYVRGPYSVELAEDLDLIGDTVPEHTDIPDEAVARLSEMFGKGPGYVEAYGTVLLVAGNSPGASRESILRRALELKPHLEDEVRDAFDHVLPDPGASVVPDSHPCEDVGIRNRAMFDRIRKRTEERIEDDELRALALGFLRFLESAVMSEPVTAELPRLICDFRHREAYYEWIFPHFSMGFVIDRDEDENGWFLILDETLGDRSMMGRFDRSFYEALAFLRSHVR